jgi:hypothetical protein
VTTVYPEAWAEGDSRLVLAFRDQRAEDVAAMFEKLTDQVVAERLSQEEVDSVAYWRSWVRIIESACKWLEKVKFVLEPKGFIEAERTDLCA